MQKRFAKTLVSLIPVLVSFVWFQCAKAQSAKPNTLPVETFQVLELPVNITEVTLQGTDKGYLLRSTLANSSDQSILGLRYLLFVVDSSNVVRGSMAHQEGCRLEGYATKTFAFPAPLKFKLKKDFHFTLLIEQVIGEISIWEVLQSRHALQAYTSGDYSVVPKVLQVSNQIDAPPRRQVIY